MNESAADRLVRRFHTLRERHRWTDSRVLRLTALGLASVPGHGVVDRLDFTVEELRKAARWTEPLTTPLRFVIAAMLVRRNLPAGPTAEAVRVTIAELKTRKLKRSATHAWIGALILVLKTGGRPGDAAVLERFAEILAAWKADHRWLTGADDYPMAAVHAGQNEPVTTLTRRIEDTYVELRKRGYAQGDALQLTSHILGLLPEDGPGAAARFCAVADALASPSKKLPSSRWDEAALLAVLPGTPENLVERARSLAEEVREGTTGSGLARVFSSLTDDLALAMGVGLVVAEAVGVSRDLETAADTATMALVQAALDAQQAATAAVIAATTVVATSSS